MDYMNLYVKNLDPDVDNNELFNAFRRFGRIVSARVMTNPATGQSKGYGFVSFSNFEDAGNALEDMNGQFLRTKPLIVAYHEPKKPRQEKSTSTTTSSFHSPPPFDYVSTPYFEAKHPYEGIYSYVHIYKYAYILLYSENEKNKGKKNSQRNICFLFSLFFSFLLFTLRS